LKKPITIIENLILLIGEITMFGMKHIAGAALALTIALSTAQATPISYTFTGIGAGTADGNAFNGSFSFVFSADTANIDASGAPFYNLSGVSGVFSSGSFTATLAPTVFIVATADPNFPRINFFNAAVTNGLGMNDPSLASFSLATSFGPLTVNSNSSFPSFLLPTLNGGGFATISGGEVSITENTSLTFEATLTAAVPEPSTWAMMVLGFAGIGCMAYRRKSKLALLAA
jgi:hypothetical protein